ncbi:MAG: chemotaxis protein CheW [Phycisphaerae bacterium]|nr:chemotaxis protein CheW [Phycisphaerae bacterium]
MSDTTQYCTFWVGGLFLGIDVLKVQEVLRPQPTTRVPLSAPTIRGLLNLRGQIVTAIDLRRKLALPERGNAEPPMNVIIRTDEGPVSLDVDEIGDVVELHADDRERPPDTVRDERRELVTHVYKLADKLMLVLDTDKAVSN